MTTHSRRYPNILVAGTPGCGKTTLCRQLQNATTPSMYHVELSDVIKREKLYEEWDDELNCSVFDTDAVLAYLENLLAKGNTIVDFHCTDIFEPDDFDFVYVLRTESDILHHRLSAREYSDDKITENIECEIFRVVLDESIETFGESKVVELQSNSNDDIQKNINIIRQALDKHKRNSTKSNKK